MVAVDRIVSAQHRLEKLDKDHVAKLGGGNLKPQAWDADLNPPGDANEVVSAAELLQQRAAALKAKNPGLSMSASIDQAMKEPTVRKAYDHERDTRLKAASRMHG